MLVVTTIGPGSSPPTRTAGRAVAAPRSPSSVRPAAVVGGAPPRWSASRLSERRRRLRRRPATARRRATRCCCGSWCGPWSPRGPARRRARRHGARRRFAGGVEHGDDAVAADAAGRREVARAVAVLGDGATCRRRRADGAPEEVTARPSTWRSRGDPAADRPLRFVHPLVRGRGVRRPVRAASARCGTNGPRGSCTSAAAPAPSRSPPTCCWPRSAATPRPSRSCGRPRRRVDRGASDSADGYLRRALGEPPGRRRAAGIADRARRARGADSRRASARAPRAGLRR